MAAGDKLFLTLGLDDQITAELNRIIGRANELRKALELSKGGNADELKKSYDNAHKIQHALYEVEKTMEHIKDARITTTDPADLSRLNQLNLRLGRIRASLKRFRDQLESNPDAMKTPSVVDAWLSRLNFKEATYQANNFASIVEGKVRRSLLDAEAASEKFSRSLSANNRSLIDTYNKVAEAGSKTSTVMTQLHNQISGFVSLYGMERLLKNIIQVGGEFEVQHIALQSILGDVQQANSMFEQMKELAVVSPFNFRQLATYSKQIAAFGIPYEEMYDTTKRLADMAAGLGVDMGRLILAYGQVRSAAVLRGQELRQFTEAGIPMVQALAQEFTRLNGRAVSTAEVFELISKRAVPFEMVKKVMWDMTNEGGRFFDMQFALSDTLAGKWSNLQDAWEIMLSEIAKGESLSGQFLKSMVTLFTKMTEAVNVLMPLLSGGALFYGMKKIQNTFSGMGLTGIDSYIKKSQQLQAIELRRKLLNQEITREEYNRGMAMNKSQARYYVLLANEGKLKDYQIQKLLLQNKIDNAKLRDLVITGELTTREAAQVRLWRMKNGEVSAFKMKMNGLFTGAGTFLKANAWMIAIDVAITALTTWYAKAEEAKAKNKELTDGFANSAKELKESYASLSENNLNSDDDYKNGIAGLKEQLKQHSANYDAIVREADAIETLAGQYTHLKTALYEESVVAMEAEGKAEEFGETTRKAFEKANESARFVLKGQGFWDVMFGADTDVERGLTDSVKKLYSKILEVIPDVGKNERSNELYRKLRNSLEEQLGIGSKERMLINIKLNELLNIDNIEDATTLVVERFGDMLSQAEPQIANKIRYSQELNQAEKDKIAQLVNDATEETKQRYPYYEKTLQQLLNNSDFVANIQLRFSTSGKKPNNLQNFIYGNFPQIIADEGIKNIATSWGESGSMYGARNAAKKDIDEVYNELVSRIDALKKLQNASVKNQKQIDAAQKLVDESNVRYRQLTSAALYGLVLDYEGEKKKSNKEKKTPKEKDTDLERIRNRVELFKKFYTEFENYSKLYGKKGAKAKLKEDDEFGAVFGFGLTNVENYKESISELISGLDNITEARDKFINSSKADIQAKKRKEEAEAIKDYVDELQRMLSVMSENYQTYKKWMDLTGDSDLASKIAGVTQNTSYADYLTEQMNMALSQAKFDLKAEDVFGLKEGEVKELGEQWGLFEIWKEWQKNQQKVRKEQWDLYEEAFKGAKNYDDKIEDINRKLRNQIELIKQNKDLTQDRKDQMIGNLEKNAAEEKAKVRWEQFKDENNWGEIFTDMDRLTTKAIDDMIVKMEEWLPKIKDNETAVKDLYNALDKMRKEKIERNPFTSLYESVQKASRLRQLLNSQIGETFTPNEKSAKYYGLRAGQTYTRDQLEGLLNELEEGFTKSLTSLGKSFKDIEDAMTPVIKLFDMLGEKGLSTLFQMGNSAIGSAVQTAQGLNNLGLGSMGPYGAAAAAALSVVSSMAAMHDEALQEEIEASQKRQAILEKVSSNLENVLERSLSSIYNFEQSDDFERARKRYEESTKKYVEWYNERLKAEERLDANANVSKGPLDPDRLDGFEYVKLQAKVNKLAYITEETVDAIQKAYDTQSYYDMQLASLLMQRDEIQHQINSEQDKKDSDSDKVNDLKEQLTQLEDQIHYFAEDLAKELYSIDFKSWANELAEALVDAWAAGEDAADAYRKKVSDILKNLGVSMLAERFIAQTLEPIMDEFISQYEKDKGVLTMDGMRILAGMYEAGNEMAQQTSAFMDGLNEIAKQYGEDWTDTDGSSSTTSSAIKSVTEQTADLLASYINAIRADVSVNRTVLTEMLAAVQSQVEMPAIARAQLAQLEQIANNTNRNAEAAVQIYDLLHKIAPDGTKWRIS